MHRNVPGVLRVRLVCVWLAWHTSADRWTQEINSVLGDYNISSQVLGTSGYGVRPRLGRNGG